MPGLAQVPGAAGLILPALTGIAEPLVAAAGLALGALMVGAVVTDIRGKNPLRPGDRTLSLCVGIGRLFVGF